MLLLLTVKKAVSILIVLLITGLCQQAWAQYTFEMMNGRLLEVFHYNDSSFVDIRFRYDRNSMKNERIRLYNEELRFKIAGQRSGELSKQELDQLVERKSKRLKSPKIKEEFTLRSDVFAIHDAQGDKKLLYEYAPEIGNDFRVDEMQEYIIGQRDARLRFQSKRSFWGGVAFGAVGGFAWQNSVFSVTTPLLWAGIVALPTIHIKSHYMSDPNMQSQPYMAGFTKVARTRNMVKGLQGSLIGTVAGALIYAIVANNSPHIN